MDLALFGESSSEPVSKTYLAGLKGWGSAFASAFASASASASVSGSPRLRDRTKASQMQQRPRLAEADIIRLPSATSPSAQQTDALMQSLRSTQASLEEAEKAAEELKRERESCAALSRDLSVSSSRASALEAMLEKQREDFESELRRQEAAVAELGERLAAREGMDAELSTLRGLLGDSEGAYREEKAISAALEESLRELRESMDRLRGEHEALKASRAVSAVGFVKVASGNKPPVAVSSGSVSRSKPGSDCTVDVVVDVDVLLTVLVLELVGLVDEDADTDELSEFDIVAELETDSDL